MRGRRGGGQSLFTKGAWLKVFSNPHYVYCLLFYHCSACCSTQSRTKSTDCDKTTLNTGDCLTGQWSCLYITDHARRANDTAYPQHSRDHMTSASRVRHGSLLVTTENVHSLPQAAAVLTADSDCRPSLSLSLSLRDQPSCIVYISRMTLVRAHTHTHNLFKNTQHNIIDNDKTTTAH